MKKIVLASPLIEVAFWDRLISELKVRCGSVEIWGEIRESEYRRSGGRYWELWKRFRIWVIFPLRVALKAAMHADKKDLIILAPTTPLYLPGLLAFAFRHEKFHIVNLLYDLYPDHLILAQFTDRKSCLSKLLAWVTCFSLKHCAATVFLGERLKSHAESQYGKARHSEIIEVGGDGNLFPVDVSPTDGNLRILYSGNLGYSHDYETLVKLLVNPLPERIEMAFHANGAGYDMLKRRLEIGRCERHAILGGPLTADAWVREMRKAQVALVTMRRGAENILFPSKAYSAMLAGQAILAICPKNSDLAKTVVGSNAGWIVEPDDVERLRELLTELSHNREKVFLCRQNAQNYARKNYDMKPIAEKWQRLFREMDRNSA